MPSADHSPTARQPTPDQSAPLQPRVTPGKQAESDDTGAMSWLKQQLDRLLVLDVFLVIGGALWFGLAVVLHGQGIERPLELFQALWQPLFTPAISLLMAAALLSGALGWWQRRGRGEVRGTGS